MLLSPSTPPFGKVSTSPLGTGLPEYPSMITQAANVQQLIFVDAAVRDYESLIVGIEDSAQVVVLNPNQDGVKQITNVLDQHENLSSVQVIAHGDVGMTQLGNAKLAANTLDTYANDVRRWGNALTEDGDLLFLGCNIAGNAEGYAFVDAISQLSSADVAASDDLTGSAQGGDWMQEVHIGIVEAESAIAPQSQAAYPYLLALPSTDDLVMALDFNEASGATAFDSSPNGLNNNGVLQNGAAFRDVGAPYGGVVDFDGIDDYISVGDSPDINIGMPQDERTISLWFNANDVNTSTQKQVLYEEGGGNRGFNLYIDNGQLYVGGWNQEPSESGWTGTYLSTNSIASDTWHHVALVLDAAPGDTSVQSNVFTAYLDGVQFGQGDGSQVWMHSDSIGLGAINTNTRFHDGISRLTGNQAFAGSLADTNLYNRALDASEIGLLTDATNLSPSPQKVALPSSSLDNDFVRHLTLDESSGIQVADTSPAGLDNPGTLQNGAQFETVGADLGNGVRLDGNDDYIQIDSSSDINLGIPKSQRTVTAWFNLDDINSPDRKQVIFEEGGRSRGLNMYVDNGQLYVGGWNIPQSNWAGTFLSTNGIRSNTWHHVALVLDAAPGDTTVQSNVFTAYLDGVSFGQGDGSQLWAHGSGVAFGAINGATLFHDESGIGTGTQSVAGVIGDGQLYNRALSASEIQTLAAINVPGSDTIPPTATVTAADLTISGGSTYDFTVTFSDDTAIDVSTLDSNDVLVTGPNSFSQVATFVSVDLNTDGTPRTATYQLTASNGMWESSNNGTYTVELVADQVSDTNGNNAIATTLGRFDVAIAPTDNDFVMHLTLDETSGTTAVDSSPSGLDNSGTLQNGAQFESVGLDLGGGVRLDGNNDYILIDSSTDIDAGSPKAKRTIAVWFRPDDVSIDSRKQVIFEEGGAGRGLNIYIEDGQLYVGGWNLEQSGWNGTFLSTNTVTSSTWQHVALVLDADPGNTTVQDGVFKAYFNGVLFDTGNGSQVWTHATDNGLGAISGVTRFDGNTTVFGSGTQAMAGVIADARLYNRALSDTEIQSLATLNVPIAADEKAPRATLSASDINTSGSETYTFTVTYTDEGTSSPSTAIDVSTLDNSDVEIKGPNGFRQFATLVSVDNNTDGLTRTATYQINSPGGRWDANDSGTYYAIIQDYGVSDVAGNTISSELLGTFEANLIPASAPIAFTEVTDAAGLTNIGASFGSSWGDFNGDGLPDLWVSNHGRPSTLYQNNGDGTFSDAANTGFSQPPVFGDTHGQAWADFDNDGDEDLIVLVGGGSGTGSGANRLYVNNNGVLTEQAAAFGLEYSVGRGRTPVWIDYDNDGLLDLWISNLVRPDGQAPPTLFRQTSNGTFEEVRTTTNVEVANSDFAVLGDFSGDGTLDILNRGFNPARNSEPLTIYDPSTIPFQDVSDSLLATDFTDVTDFAVADFNNDLQTDLFLAQNNQVADINQETTTLLEVNLLSLRSELGLEFTSSGDITFDLTETNSFALNEIFIGTTGFNPTDKEFTLLASDTNVEGIAPHTGGSDKGIYIGYDPVEQEWQMLASSSFRATTRAEIHSTNTNFTCNCSFCCGNNDITGVNSIGFDDNAPSVDDQLLINSAQGLVNQTQSSGLNDISNFSESVVAGDFDNDMDVDLYVLTTDRLTNRSNILYENQGDGTFTRVAGAGGAAGSLLGVGDSVTTADYDSDGFLDLFVTNGAGPTPYNEDGPNQLFRNQGNENHWLQIDLSGVTSNRDGIGAQVFVTAGGVTQMREMSGGVHKFAQNHDRLHFGLAGNDTIDEIVIRWPSGTEQTITNVSADQTLTILETD